MSSQQQAMILDTIVAVKKALKRKAYESDSDSSIDRTTNRGHKLQKKARFVRRGHLSPALPLGAYKEVIEYAGYQRAIISRNPPLIDEDGYEIDSDDDDERVQEAMEAAAEDNPYSSIHLENILAPLTSVTDLPTHPTLSRPFTSKALTELAIHGRNLMHKENAALWQVRPLLTRLQGDHTWIPCGMLTQPGDIDLFADDYLTRFHPRGTGSSSRRSEGTPITNGSEKKAPPPLGPAPDAGRPGHETEDKPAATDSSAQEDGPTVNTTSEIPSDSASADKKVPLDGDQVDNNPARDEGQKEVNGAWSNGATQADTHEAAETKDQPAAGNGEADVEMSEPSKTDGIIEAHANSGSHPSESRAVSVATDGTDDLFIHPLFLPPRSAHPDRDQGLLEPEAEDIRRLLQLYVQKQEEICRGVTKLYIDLLKADRYRKTVLKWAKAEAHCGDARDMSDGEDWYDKEEWGLVEDLKKGQDEEEEDTTQPQKKTRNRK